MYKLLYKLYFLRFRLKKIDNWHTRIIVRIFNQILPFYFILTKNNKSNKLVKIKNINGENYIISLTTFPKRIDRVWLTIESILRQEVKTNKLIIWLYEGEFNGKKSLPKYLLQQEKRGLEIRFVKENLMPHKKYYYAMKEFPDANIITIDDDTFYPPDLVRKLKSTHINHPKSVCSVISRKINSKNTQLLSYSTWKYAKLNTRPRKYLLPIGVGSVLYPIGSLNKEVFNKEKLKALALTADDLWLKIMSLKNNTKVVGLGGEYSRFFVPIIYKDDDRLMDSNIGESNNDKVFRKLLEYYIVPVSIFNEENNE